MIQQWKISLKKHFNSFIGRVHKNIKGQVAIFVALVFQVIFILFALMINVGLLIHHKINLQQSTDLAAYYGAMKQAEILNVVSHVNFQIRQAYKLMAWRYRILGTFGMQNDNSPAASSGQPIIFPIKHNPVPAPNPFQYQQSSENDECIFDNVRISALRIPFMCVNHYGFKEYNPTSETETFCKANCLRYKGDALTIPRIGDAPPGGAGNYDTGIIGAINTAIAQANQRITNACHGTGPINALMLSKFYASYLQEVKNRMLFIKMLMANLSTGETETLDIEGNKVFDGVKNTLINNLTEANNTSFEKDGNIFETYNSVSAARGSECGYANIDETKSESGIANLFADINFKYIKYFIVLCEGSINSTKNFRALPILNDLTRDLDAMLFNQIEAQLRDRQLAENIKRIMATNNFDHTIGIEKNPWCSIYYGVKATTSPVIPFLPISKVTLHATSFAKPFGGSIGPRQYQNWPSSDRRSSPAGGPSTQTDLNLPIQNPIPSDLTTPKDNEKLLLNYANYVGDSNGLADAKIVGLYHDMLLNRSVTFNSNNHQVSRSKIPESPTTIGRDNVNPTQWPAYSEWNYIAETMDSPSYDPLAIATKQGAINSETNIYRNSFMRDIEISVVAPNQFEMTYYSIEPDFYNVYIKDKLGKPGVLDKFKERAGLSPSAKIFIPKDFGHNDRLAQQGDIPQFYSVRNQMEVVHHIMRNAQQSAPPTLTTYNFGGQPRSLNIEQVASMYFTYIPYLPGSLLTSWTMKDLISDDFSVIPNANDTKTPFAACLDEDLHGNNGYGSIADVDNPQGGTDKLPPAPGNCITGGRTGYSVKIVSPEGLMTETVGNQQGPIRNPPTGFIVF